VAADEHFCRTQDALRGEYQRSMGTGGDMRDHRLAMDPIAEKSYYSINKQLT
jgi:hypothetical protein